MTKRQSSGPHNGVAVFCRLGNRDEGDYRKGIDSLSGAPYRYWLLSPMLRV
jgi:hypothetical protein